ncbi:hypothetical protein Tco_1050559, partial [Tanacetum coccineum]
EMNNPGTTIEEYVQFETEKALRNGQVYNLEIAKYGKINWSLEDADINVLKFFETKFRAIIYDDALKLENDRHAWLRFDTQDYTVEEIRDFKSRLGRIYDRQHTDAEGQVMFTSYAWRALFGIHGPLEMETDWFRAYWDVSLRVIDSKADYWTGISFSGDFLTLVPSYTQIREPLRRLCCRLIAFTIAGRGQAPEKVTTTNLLSEEVIMEESLQTLNVEFCALTTIDIDELVRLRFCDRLGDVVTWVALGPRMQQAAGRAAQIDPEAPQEDVPASQEGVQADPAPV